MTEKCDGDHGGTPCGDPGCWLRPNPGNIGQGCVQTPTTILGMPPMLPPGALTLTLRDRGQDYGDFSLMADVAQDLKSIIQDGPAWKIMTASQREALDVIATKIARIVCGNPDLKDSWHDIQGYAKLAEDRCRPAATP